MWHFYKIKGITIKRKKKIQIICSQKGGESMFYLEDVIQMAILLMALYGFGCLVLKFWKKFALSHYL